MSGMMAVDNVIVMGATNYPWYLPMAVKNRFQEQIIIPLPTAEAICAKLFFDMRK